ncbi:hypothetical protein B0H14DRAFT_2829616 [Mycena olivaceomarginata]|nr:hypothetical protein B0H14DRAFT_2829616 [Mycena olivaceomarginata]
MRGRHVYRGGRGVGFVHPSTSNTRTQRAMVEASHPSIYDSQTPVVDGEDDYEPACACFLFFSSTPCLFFFFLRARRRQRQPEYGVICVEWRGGAGATPSSAIEWTASSATSSPCPAIARGFGGIRCLIAYRAACSYIPRPGAAPRAPALCIPVGVCCALGVDRGACAGGECMNV